MEEGKLYYSITEVAQDLGVNASLLRYWEKEFPCIKPRKNKRGVRSYTATDIAMLRRILYLTRDCGYTLEGAKEQLKTNTDSDKSMQLVSTLKQLRAFLVDLKEQI